jgi:hypothetical protein
VILNATKVVIAKKGKVEGRRTILSLLRRSFTDPEEIVLAELRDLVEN